MKMIIALLIAMSLNADTFFEQEDKQKHIVGTAVISATATGLARRYGSNKFEAIAIGISTGLLVGIVKEAIDGRGYGTEDVGDVYADTLGSIGGSIIAAQFKWEF
jgi:VanZ family protein